MLLLPPFRARGDVDGSGSSRSGRVRARSGLGRRGREQPRRNRSSWSSSSALGPQRSLFIVATSSPPPFAAKESRRDPGSFARGGGHLSLNDFCFF